jgi:hypothetical protein
MKSSLLAAVASLLVLLAASCMTPEEAAPPTDDEVGQVAETPAIASSDDLDLSQEELDALDLFPQQCGAVVCTGKTHCCNASCSRCVPFGVECPQEACLTTTPPAK